MAEKNFSTDQIQISYCGIISFQALNEDLSPLRPADIDGHSFKVQVKLSTAEGNWLRVLLKIDCTAHPKNDKAKTLDGSITTECFFSVAGLDDLIKGKEINPVPQPIAITAVSIAYSTTRGLLASKASGTFLEGAVLPIVQPALLFSPEEQILQSNKLKFID